MLEVSFCNKLVERDSPADIATLKAGQDFIIAALDFAYTTIDEFTEQVEELLYKTKYCKLKLIVFNIKYMELRVVSIHPNTPGSGLPMLGAEFATGILNNFYSAIEGKEFSTSLTTHDENVLQIIEDLPEKLDIESKLTEDLQIDEEPTQKTSLKSIPEVLRSDPSTKIDLDPSIPSIQMRNPSSYFVPPRKKRGINKEVESFTREGKPKYSKAIYSAGFCKVVKDEFDNSSSSILNHLEPASTIKKKYFEKRAIHLVSNTPGKLVFNLPGVKVAYTIEAKQLFLLKDRKIV